MIIFGRIILVLLLKLKIVYSKNFFFLNIIIKIPGKSAKLVIITLQKPRSQAKSKSIGQSLLLYSS